MVGTPTHAGSQVYKWVKIDDPTRGKKGIYYIRGSVSLGDKHIEVQEFSLRTTDRDAAAHLMSEHETKLRHQLMFGPAALVAQGTIAQAFDSYLTKAKPPCASDVLRIGKLNGLIGDFSLREPKQAWEHFRRAYLTGHDPAGQDRYRSVFQAAINVYHELHDLPPLRIKAIPFNNERMRFLSKVDRDRLIAAYVPHVQPIITMLAFQGPRIQTALQMPWGVEGVDMDEGSIRLNHSKRSHQVGANASSRVRGATPDLGGAGSTGQGARLPQPVRRALSGHAQGQDPRRQPDQTTARDRLPARGDRGFHRP